MPEKNDLQPWKTQRFCIPERESGRFVSRMERVLKLYTAPHDPDEPLIAMDESSTQLLGHVHEPQPMKPGRPRRQDDQYRRNGVRALFMFFDPLRGWRRVTSSGQRTKQDWAREVKRLLDQDYPQARRVHLLCDNLNVHDESSLYETFPPAVDSTEMVRAGSAPLNAIPSPAPTTESGPLKTWLVPPCPSTWTQST